MKKSFFTCPRCGQLIKVEGEVLAVKHPDDGEPMTSNDDGAQTNRESVTNGSES